MAEIPMLLSQLGITTEEEVAGLHIIFDLGVELPIPPERTRQLAGYLGRIEAELTAAKLEVERLKAELDEHSLNDGMLRHEYEHSGLASRFTWSGWLLQLVRDNAALRAQVERLSSVLEALVAKLRILLPIADSYIAFQCIRSGTNYDGPQIVDELAAAAALLAERNKQ